MEVSKRKIEIEIEIAKLKKYARLGNVLAESLKAQRKLEEKMTYWDTIFKSNSSREKILREIELVMNEKVKEIDMKRVEERLTEIMRESQGSGEPIKCFEELCKLQDLIKDGKYSKEVEIEVNLQF